MSIWTSEASTTDPSRLVFGPVRHGDAVVRLRPPRLSDFARWREIRLRDRAHIEPYWASSPLAWEQRHTPRLWARECLVARAAMRAGRRYSGVVEIDGQFAGQVDYTVVDPVSATAEVSAWIESDAAGRGLMGLALFLVCDTMFGTHGITRLLAPVSTENRAAQRCLAGLGFRHQATMALAYDAGGARKDHALWAMTPADLATDRLPPLIPADAHRPTPAAAARAVSRRVLALAATRLWVWRLRERLRRYRPTRPVSLPVPDQPNTVVRTLTSADRESWLRYAPSVCEPSGRGAWYRARWHARFGLHSPTGLRLVLEVDGSVAGEIRLYDSPLPCQATGLYTWADPDRVDAGLWAAAVRAVVDHGFGALGVRRFAAEVPVDAPAAKVLDAAGFHHEGVLTGHRGPSGHTTDHDLWGLT
ncbi:GNAT family N-acetyltransferase [Nocardia rhizosphaerae]|uniref:GNAT family N-acetyltransferase n=1 Tax=Nocardia rhizosphaerae TaxID=1691571 RepID=A0ABV8LCS7_9NOCA